MDGVKIDNFLRAHPGLQFPEFQSLAPVRCAEIRQGIAHRLGLPSDAAPLDVISKLHDRVGRVLGSVPDSGVLDLRATLLTAGVNDCDRICLNWYRFNEIDEIGVDDMSRWFDDIWYPASDDIDLFDSTLDWILSVSHSGLIDLRRLDMPA